jgi:iron complex outermembrane recepter protein
VRGLDLKIDHSFTTRLGAFALGLNGGYVLDFRQAASTTSPLSSVLDTVGNPIALRIRGTADWYQHGVDRPGFGASLTVDRFGGYEDSDGASFLAVSALTTVDLRTGYRTSAGNGALDDLEFSLNASNLFDQAPPFVDSAAGYDMINAQPYGRVISFSVQKRW